MRLGRGKEGIRPMALFSIQRHEEVVYANSGVPPRCEPYPMRLGAHLVLQSSPLSSSSPSPNSSASSSSVASNPDEDMNFSSLASAIGQMLAQRSPPEKQITMGGGECLCLLVQVPDGRSKVAYSFAPRACSLVLRSLSRHTLPQSRSASQGYIL